MMKKRVNRFLPFSVPHSLRQSTNWTSCNCQPSNYFTLSIDVHATGQTLLISRTTFLNKIDGVQDNGPIRSSHRVH